MVRTGYGDFQHTGRRGVAIVAVWALMAVLMSPADPAAAASRNDGVGRQLSDQLPPALTAASLQVPLSPGEADQAIQVTLTLKRTSEAGFEQFLADVENPASPDYRHFATQSTLADRYGPSEHSYKQVGDWLRAEGLITGKPSTDRLTVTASGTRTVVARAFGVKIVDYSIGGRLYFGPDSTPVLASSIADAVQSVSGLTNISAPRVPANDKLPAQCLLYDVVGGASISPLTGITVLELIAALLFITVPILAILGATLSVLAIGSGLTCLLAIVGDQWGSSYGTSGFQSQSLSRSAQPATVQSPTSASVHSQAAPTQKIGLLEFDSYHPSDVTDWLSALGADPTIANRLSKVDVGGGVVAPGAGEPEVLLDIATVMQLAPEAPTKYVVYDAAPTASFESMFNTMINDGDTVISNSWAACEDQVSSAEAHSIDSVLAEAAATGVSVVNGAGDHGSTCADGSPATVSVPADSPHATAVGGTSAKPLVGGLYAGSTWWDGSHSTPPTGQGGFGVSRYFPRPSYQDGQTTSPMRSVPDLSAIADPADGVQICQADAGGCPSGLSYGGTSMSAPEVAAAVANINFHVGHNIGEINPALYPLAGTHAFESATSMGSDFAHVGLGSPDPILVSLALRGVPAGAVDATKSIAVSSGTVGADGKSDALVDAFLTDAGGAPVSGKTVSVTTTSQTAAVAALQSTSQVAGGAVAFEVTDTVPETIAFTVTDTTDGTVLSTHPTITFTPPVATGASIVASPAQVVTDGTTPTTISVYLQDSRSRPAAGKTVSLSAGVSNAVISPASRQAVTDASGTATFTATDTATEAVTFTASDTTDGNLPVPGSALVTFQPQTSPTCADTAPSPTAGHALSVFASGLADNSQALVTNVGGLTFTTPACGEHALVAFDASGNAYVPDGINGEIYKLGPSGGTTGPGAALPDTTFLPGGQLGAIAFANGQLYASLNNTNGNFNLPQIVQIDPTTGATLRVVATAATGLGPCPGWMAVDPLSGDLFTTDNCGGALSSRNVWRTSNPAGANPTTTVYAIVDGSAGLAFAPDGTLYVADLANQSIMSVTGTNTATPVVSSVYHQANAIFGVAVATTDSHGHATTLDVSDDVDTITQINLTSPVTAAVIGTTNAAGGLLLSGAAIGPDGCLYVADQDHLLRMTGVNAACTGGGGTPGPEIILSETGSPTPATGTPVTFTAALVNFPTPAGTALHFEVTGANAQPKLVDADPTGHGTFSYSGVFAGGDRITALAIDNGAVISSAPIQVRWIAGKQTTFLSLNQSQQGGGTGRPATLSANLSDVSQSPPIPVPAASVTISLGGQSCTVITDASGNGSCVVTPTGPLGLEPTTAHYAGSAVYTAANATDTFDLSAPGGAPAPPPPTTVNGYWLVAADGGVFTFGGATFFGSEGGHHLNAPIVGMAATPTGRGYWLLASDGGIFAFGDAGFYGSEGNHHLNAPVVAMAATPDGRGYWLLAADGGIFTFGDATYYGSTGDRRLNAPVVGMTASPGGGGYWLVARDGGVFSFGDAPFHGSTGNLRLNQPVVGIAPTPDRGGYWLDASDGGVFTFGDASFYGSEGAHPLNRPVVGMAASPSGAGYWLDASDGGIFTHGDATFYGSEGGQHLNAPVVAMAASPVVAVAATARRMQGR